MDAQDSSLPSDAAEEPGLATIENDPFGLLLGPSTDNTPQASPNPASATLGSPIAIPGPPSSHSPSEVGTPRPSMPPNGARRFRFQDLDEGHESVDLSVGSLRTQSLADTASNQSTPIEWSPTSSQARPIVNDSSNFNNPRAEYEDVPLDPIVRMQARVPYVYWELDAHLDIRPRTDQEDEDQRLLNGTSLQLMVIRLMCYRP